MKRHLLSIFGSFVLLALLPLSADTVTTRDGSTLVGTIKGIHKGTLTLNTSYAGDIEIDMAEVASFSSDNPLFVRLESGTVLQGTVSDAEGEAIEVSGQDGAMQTEAAAVAASWLPGQVDPDIKAMERKVSYQLAFDLSGKTGNTDEFTLGVSGTARMRGPKDETVIYGSYRRSEADGNTTADEIIGGVRYSNYFMDHFGWYTRVELENDAFENLDLRTTGSVGGTYRWKDTDTFRLVGRLGLAYRYESFNDGTSDESPALDVGLSHYQQLGFADWYNELSYVPSFEDFGNFRVVQDSWINLPIEDSDWAMRVGLKNDYNSEPAAGNTELDTTYYVRLVLDL
jgi:putative salt-induced outer membrane protein YdiY